MSIKKIVAGLAVVVLVTVSAVTALQMQRVQASEPGNGRTVKIAAQGNGNEKHGGDDRKGDDDRGTGGRNQGDSSSGRKTDKNNNDNNNGRRSGNDSRSDDEHDRRPTVQIGGNVTSFTATSVVIGGQTITIDGNTRINGNLRVGFRAEVKAVRQADGSLLALKIETNRGNHYGSDNRTKDRDDEGDNDNDEDDDDEDGDNHGQPPAVALQAPADLVAAVFGGQVNLTWTDNSTNEAGFRIDRATDTAFLNNVAAATVAANVTAYADNTVVAGNTYYYRVLAYSGPSTSPPSNTASAAVPAAGVALQAPTGLVAALSGGQVNLTWTDNNTAEWGFRIQRATDFAFLNNLVTVTTSANVTAYSDNTVAAGNTYYYRVFAYDGGGASPASNTASVGIPSTIDAAALYISYCQSCHGVDRQGGSAARLTAAALSGRTVTQVATITANGTSGMPAYSSILTVEQIQALAQYLKNTP